MSEAIVITGKGGIGKTTVCAVLGGTLALMGRRVLLVDASLGMRGLDLPLGLENDVQNHLVDVLRGSCGPEDAILKVPGCEGLCLLPAPQTRLSTDVGFYEMKVLIRHLKEMFDLVLIDAPEAPERGFSLALSGADRGLILMSCDSASLRAAGRISGLLQENHLWENQVFFNRLYPFGEAGSCRPQEAEDLLGIPVAGAVPECRELAFLQEKSCQFLTDENNTVTAAFRQAAGRLLGEDIPLVYPEPHSEKKGLLERLLHG